MTTRTSAVGEPLDRLDGPLKVRGEAVYAYENRVDNPAYLALVLSSIAKGRIVSLDDSAALAVPGVLAVLTHENAPKLAGHDPELSALTSNAVYWRKQVVAAVVAETSEAARHAAGLVGVEYEQELHSAVMHPGQDLAEKPAGHAAMFGTWEGELQNGMPADTALGDVDAAMSSAPVTVDETYSMPFQFQSPMEPHSAVARWTAPDELTIHCTSQGVTEARGWIAMTLGLEPEKIRLLSPHVGGGFGSKVFPQSYAVLAAMAAKAVDRPVKLMLTREQMFFMTGYRAPSRHRLQLGAERDGTLTAIAHDSVQQSSNVKKYAEQVAAVTRSMWAAPNRRTTHRLVPLDFAVPTIMRGPGEVQGTFPLESAMDEMAIELGMDPIEFRIRNETDVDPENGMPFSSRHVVECMRDGARRFGWEGRDPTPRARRENGWLIGTGMATGSYVAPQMPGNATRVRTAPGGRFIVSTAAADIGTGTWTSLSQIAADGLGVDVGSVTMEIGDTDLPPASTAGFSSGTSSWGASVVAATAEMRRVLDSEHGGVVPEEGIDLTVEAPGNAYQSQYAMHAYGAQFVEARVHEETGTIRIQRMLGVFDGGRIINPKTARSQFIGGMTQGISMTLHEAGVVDPRFGQLVNHDFASYHITANADVRSVEAHWIDSVDPYTNPLGTKGIGEICIVGAAAAIANAVYHATGVRVRDLPITLDKLMPQEL